MKFKSPKVEERFANCHPVLQQLVHEMDEWMRNKFFKEFTITESKTTGEEDAKLNRASSTHREGRAVDIRTKGFSVELIEAFHVYFTTLYNKRLGALTKDGPNLIYYKPHGTGPHFHIQIRRGLSPTLKINNYYQQVKEGKDHGQT